MAVGRLPGFDAGDVELHDLRLFGLGAEGRDDRMQRPHPGQRAVPRGALAPAHLLRPREGANDKRNDFRDHVDGGTARLLDQRDIEIALRVALDLRFIERLQPGGFQKALHGGIGRAHLRALALLLEVRLTLRNAMHGECETARRHECFRAFIDEPFGHQLVGDHLAQVIRRLRLHARGNFFGEQFEQQIGHETYSPPPACGGEGSGVGGTRWAMAAEITSATPSALFRTSLVQNRRTR